MRKLGLVLVTMSLCRGERRIQAHRSIFRSSSNRIHPARSTRYTASLTLVLGGGNAPQNIPGLSPLSSERGESPTAGAERRRKLGRLAKAHFTVHDMKHPHPLRPTRLTAMEHYLHS